MNTAEMIAIAARGIEMLRLDDAGATCARAITLVAVCTAGAATSRAAVDVGRAFMICAATCDGVRSLRRDAASMLMRDQSSASGVN